MTARSRDFLVSKRSSLIRKLALLGIVLLSSSCNMTARLTDQESIVVGTGDFSKPIYINRDHFEFDITVSLKGDPSLQPATLHVFESEACEGPSVTIGQSSTTRMEAADLEDGKKYSFRIAFRTDKKEYLSACTPWVGVDRQDPDAVSTVLPLGDDFIAQDRMLARWEAALDNGISGLAEKAYRVSLYAAANCAGAPVETFDGDSLAHEFGSLEHGFFYSYRISAIDRAGNVGPSSCSPNTEIDLYVPGLVVSHPGSDAGFAESSVVSVTTTNDSSVGFWCLTENLSFMPTSNADACPGGAGPVNGWFTEPPTTYTLSAGEGLKQVALWVLSPLNARLTDRRALASVEVDQTPPSTFTVAGIAGGSDEVGDAFLTSVSDNPIVQWTAAADPNLAGYSVEILDDDGNLNCSGTATMSATSLEIEGCAFEAGQTYTAIVTARDHAGNETDAAAFDFEIDLDPPGAFSIAGVGGAGDSIVDAWAPGAPIVSWSGSADAVSYALSIRDTGQAEICSEQTVAAPATTFDFASATCSAFANGGTYEVLLRSRDVASLETAATNQPFSFRVDSQAPELTLTRTPPALSEATVTDFEYEVSDPLSGLASVQCRFDGAAYADCASPLTTPTLAQGVYTFDVQARDNVGNLVTRSHAFAVDLSPPTVTIVSGPSAYDSSTGPQIQFSAVDSGAAGVSRFECRLDGGSWQLCASPYVMVALADGPHVVKIRAYDALEHLSDEAVHSWTIDTSPPTVSIDSGPSSPTEDTSASVAFSAADGESPIAVMECRWDAGAWGACSSPASTTGLPGGARTFEVRVTNAAGLSSSATHAWTVYTFSWSSASWGSCSASPSWSGWGSCSSICGTGTQWRSCLNTSGTQTRTVSCQRSDGATVADAKCTTTKPSTSQGCSGSCSGSSTQSCSATCRVRCRNVSSGAEQDMGSAGSPWDWLTQPAPAGASTWMVRANGADAFNCYNYGHHPSEDARSQDCCNMFGVCDSVNGRASLSCWNY